MQQFADGGVHWIVDTQQTGYIVPRRQSLAIVRRRQVRRDQHDRAETEGVFACAWLDHGAAPSEAGYHYAVIPNAGLGATAAFTQAIGGDADPPYRVLRRDRQVHAVAAKTADGIVATAAFFEPATLEPGLEMVPAVTVDRPCLLVAEHGGGQLTVVISDPDLRLADFRSQAAETAVTLAGAWQPAAGFPDAARWTHSREGVTRLVVSCRDGRSVALPLTPVQPR